MPRRARSIVGGYAYHFLNRANGRLRLFKKPADFAACERALEEAFARVPLRILGYTLMPNHWHFVVWPRQRQNQQVSEFFRWLTVTQRWHAHHGTSGLGHVYQGRFKSFPIAEDEHLLSVLRYVERNPLRAGLVERAEEWRWSSLHRRRWGTPEERALLAEPPVPLGRWWCAYVNRPQSAAEEAAIRRSIARGQPYGAGDWQAKVCGNCSWSTRSVPAGDRKSTRPQTRPQSHPTMTPVPFILLAHPKCVTWRNPPLDNGCASLCIEAWRAFAYGTPFALSGRAARVFPRVSNCLFLFSYAAFRYQRQNYSNQP